MSTFFLNTNSTMARTLGNGETGIIAPDGALYIAGGPAVTGSGDTELMIDGSLYAWNGSYNAYDFDGSSTKVIIGDTGNVFAPESSALSLSALNYVYVSNAGEIWGGEFGIDLLQVEATAVMRVENTGSITGALSGILLNTGFEPADINNSGEIVGLANYGVWITGSSRTVLTNDGTISGPDGSINGGNVPGNEDLITNGGVLNGSVFLQLGNDVFVNTGAVRATAGLSTGAAVDMGLGQDYVRNFGGTITGNVVAGDGSDTIINTGVIDGSVYVNSPINPAASYSEYVANHGSIFGTIYGDAGRDIVVNAGIVSNRVELGSDSDFYAALGTGQVLGSILGEQGNDTIIGGSGQDYADGGTENDSLVGRGGEDTLLGQGGNDTLLGGDGDDSLNGGAGSDSIGAGAGDDTVIGEGGNDTITGHDGNDVVEANDGADLVYGGRGDDNLNGGNGLDTIYGGDGADSIGGGENDDLLNGGEGNDSLLGWLGNDQLFGAAGNDTLNGQAGADTLNGGWGDDLLTGGTEADVFVFIVQNGIDVVTDFENNTDLIDLTAFHTSFGAMSGAISDFNGGALIDFAMMGGSGSAWIQGTPAAFLNNNDFIF